MADGMRIIRAYYLDPFVHLYEVGHWVAGGPISERGYYVDPFCHPGCCRPDGPFATEAAARDWAREESAGIEAGENSAEE